MLDYQLRHGIWDERRIDYARSEFYGHWDAGQAAVYANRLVNWKWNPIPDDMVAVMRARPIAPYASTSTILRVLRGY
jgi:hypothetical protein